MIYCIMPTYYLSSLLLFPVSFLALRIYYTVYLQFRRTAVRNAMSRRAVLSQYTHTSIQHTQPCRKQAAEGRVGIHQTRELRITTRRTRSVVNKSSEPPTKKREKSS